MIRRFQNGMQSETTVTVLQIYETTLQRVYEGKVADFSTLEMIEICEIKGESELYISIII